MKRIFALLSAVAMALTLVACGEASGSTSSSGQSSGDTITIKLPHCYVEGHPLTDTLQNFFKPELESRSNGRLTVDIYPNSTLATEEQIYEGLRNNTYEMGVVGTIFQDRIPSVAAFQLPFLFTDYDQDRAALYDGDYGYQLIGDVASIGFTVNGIVPDGFRVMTMNKKVESLADMHGLKMRMPNLEILKTDAITGKPVAGVTFTVKRVDSSTLTTVTSDENGRCYLEKLMPGVYEIWEQSVPDGYLLNEAHQMITLFPNRTGTVQFQNYPKPTLTVNKIDSITGDPIRPLPVRFVILVPTTRMRTVSSSSISWMTAGTPSLSWSLLRAIPSKIPLPSRSMWKRGAARSSLLRTPP